MEQIFAVVVSNRTFVLTTEEGKIMWKVRDRMIHGSHTHTHTHTHTSHLYTLFYKKIPQLWAPQSFLKIREESMLFLHPRPNRVLFFLLELRRYLHLFFLLLASIYKELGQFLRCCAGEMGWLSRINSYFTAWIPHLVKNQPIWALKVFKSFLFFHSAIAIATVKICLWHTLFKMRRDLSKKISFENLSRSGPIQKPLFYETRSRGFGRY